MKVLVLGGTGATGKLVIDELLKKNIEVRAIVRSTQKLLPGMLDNNLLTIIIDSIENIDITKATEYVKGYDAIISCLGHNLNFRGIYGKPLNLVTHAIKTFSLAIESLNLKNSVKIILMNTTGNRNPDIEEKISLKEKFVIGLIRFLLPPQRDNENASKYLRSNIGNNNKNIKWTAVRPDTLINSDEVSNYKVYESPVRSAIFDPGTTSRINVANFMSELITDDKLWIQWIGKMPVIYNV